MPSSAGKGHEARVKQHTCLPGNRGGPCSMEKLGVVLAEALVLHGCQLVAMKWELKHGINPQKGLEALGYLQHQKTHKQTKAKQTNKQNHYINLNRKTSSSSTAETDRVGQGKAAGQIAAWGVQWSATTKPRDRKEQKNTAGMTETSCTKQWQPAGEVQPEQVEKKARPPIRKPGPSWKLGCWLALVALHSSARVGTHRYHATLKTTGNGYSSSTWLC